MRNRQEAVRWLHRNRKNFRFAGRKGGIRVKNKGFTPVDKGSPGYIKNQKKVSLLWLLLFVVIGLVIFLIGYFLTHTRANIFTVAAVLMVLPAAKRIVNLIVMLPRASVAQERYDRMKDAVGDAVLYTDYVFTSTEKIMHLDFVVIKNGNVLGVIAPSKQDVDYMKKYVSDSIHKMAPDFKVRLFDTDEQLINYLSKMSRVEAAPAREEKIAEYLHSLAV